MKNTSNGKIQGTEFKGVAEERYLNGKIQGTESSKGVADEGNLN